MWLVWAQPVSNFPTHHHSQPEARKEKMCRRLGTIPLSPFLLTQSSTSFSFFFLRRGKYMRRKSDRTTREYRFMVGRWLWQFCENWEVHQVQHSEEENTNLNAIILFFSQVSLRPNFRSHLATVRVAFSLCFFFRCRLHKQDFPLRFWARVCLWVSSGRDRKNWTEKAEFFSLHMCRSFSFLG